MKKLTPKEQHEQLLANVDREKIIQSLSNDEEHGVTKVAVVLARECILYVHFLRLWQLRVFDLEPRLSTEKYMRNVYVKRNALYKTLVKAEEELGNRAKAIHNAEQARRVRV